MEAPKSKTGSFLMRIFSQIAKCHKVDILKGQAYLTHLSDITWIFWRYATTSIKTHRSMNAFKPNSTKAWILTWLLPIAGWSQDALAPIQSGVYKWSETTPATSEQMTTRSFVKGSSTHLAYLEIYGVTQSPGATNNLEADPALEKCIIVTEGTAKVTVPGERSTLGPAGVVLLMPNEPLLIENTGTGDLTYYVMQYKSRKDMHLPRGKTGGGSMAFNADSLNFRSHSRGGARSYFDRPTAMCERFEMHVTRLDRKGPSHAPHAHEETEIILVLSGATAQMIDGKEYVGSPGDFYLMGSQLSHSIRNTQDVPCMYFAFKWM